MTRRINRSLPEETIRLLDAVAPRGERSHGSAEAVTKHVTEMGKVRLRKSMKDRALKRADRDLRIAEEWFPIDEEAWGGRSE